MCWCLHTMVATCVLFFSLPACTLWQRKDNAFWPQSYIQTRMHHHNISGYLLCVRQLWGGQSQDEVSLVAVIKQDIINYRSWINRWKQSTHCTFYIWLNKKNIFFSHNIMLISGSLLRPSSVPSQFDTTLTPRVWMCLKTLPASTVWWRSFGMSLTSSVMPSAGWTSTWGSDGPGSSWSYPPTVH